MIDIFRDSYEVSTDNYVIFISSGCIHFFWEGGGGGGAGGDTEPVGNTLHVQTTGKHQLNWARTSDAPSPHTHPT